MGLEMFGVRGYLAQDARVHGAQGVAWKSRKVGCKERNHTDTENDRIPIQNEDRKAG